MFRYWVSAGIAALVAGVGVQVLPEASAKNAAMSSGIDLQYVDHSVRPQDDLYRYLNGKWLDSFQIPADRGNYIAFTAALDETELQLRGIVEGLAKSSPQDADALKISDLYASFMDEPLLDTLGLKPLLTEFASIEAINDRREIPEVIAHLTKIGAPALYELEVLPDARKAAQYAVILEQGRFGETGLGLPDRDYYLKDEAKLKDVRGKYLAHIGRLLGMTGDTDAAAHAAAILKLETEIARAQWTRVEDRDPVKSYNKIGLADLPKLMANYEWRRYLHGIEIEGRVDSVIINQPSYFTSLGTLMATTPLPVWKSFFKWQVLRVAAPYLSKPFVDESFAFNLTEMRGIPANKARWKRGLALINYGALGEALGKFYVAKYFSPQNKARMEALVRNLLTAYAQDIDTLDWMSPETKVGAKAKVAKMVTKIGYPKTWRDYSTLRIVRDDLWGNVVRCKEFEFRRNINKLGKRVDRDEWQSPPQTVNASYVPRMNEIVFPAGILQPPFFNAKADDAANYGGIGAIIAHEISHGFDDEGSQYDADGNLRDWFVKEDHDKFAAKTRALVGQYSAYEPVPGYHLNGELTLGENIADNSGLAIAYKAYQLSLKGRTAPVIDGFTGDQRFYLGWVQVWRGKIRESEAIYYLKTDTHSPPPLRGFAPLRNQAGFYSAFGVKEGDKMYLPPDKRVNIW
jgi:putative endopeptidase